MRQFVYVFHAVQQMRIRGITTVEVERTVENGERIENYPDTKPFPSRLVLGLRQDGKPLHVVAADDPNSDETRIITTYEPDLQRWEPDWKTRKGKP